MLVVGWLVTALASSRPADHSVPLDQASVDELDRGATVWGQTGSGGRDRAWGARVVAASCDEVWTQIQDYGGYDAIWPYVSHSTLDAVHYEGAAPVYDATVHLLVRGVLARFALESRPHRDEGWLEFRATPASPGPVEAVTGWWRVEPWRGDPTRSLVTWSVEVDSDWWIPGWVRAVASRKGVPLVLDALARRVEGDDGLAITAK